MAKLRIDDYVVGSAGNGFLRKVSLVTKLSDYKYNLETIEASLEEVIKQGTGVFSKVMTYGDLDPNLFANKQNNTKALNNTSNTPASASDSIKQKSISFSEIDGVELIPSADPNDTTFTIRIGNPDSSLQNVPRSERAGGGISGTVYLYKDIVQAKGEVKVNIKMDVGASYELFSLEYFKLIPEVNTEEKLEIFIGDQVDINNIEKKLGTISFPAIFFTIGIVPVYITSGVDIYIGLDGKVTAKVNTGIQFKQQWRRGVVYNRNAGINVISDFNSSWNFLEPKAEVSYEATSFIKPETYIKLYGNIGPSVPLRAYLKLKTEMVADTNPDIWKNKQCLGGYDNVAWVGIDSEVKWNLVDDNNKFGKFLSKYLKALEVSAQLFKKEWLIKRWNVGGKCDYSKTPPKLKVTGDHINETTTALSNINITKEYTISNIGGTQLDWKVDYIEDNVISLSEKSGKLQPNESKIITVTLNPSILDVGNYHNKLEFNNNYQFGIIADDISGSTERKVFVKIIPSSISSPIDFKAELFKPTTVELTWDYPSTEKYINYVKGYRIFQSTDETNWESIVTLNSVNDKYYLVPNLQTDTIYYFKIDAYTDDIYSSSVSTSIDTTINAPIYQGGLDASINIKENGSETISVVNAFKDKETKQEDLIFSFEIIEGSDIVSISQNGAEITIEGKKQGKATILVTATDEDGFFGTKSFDVNVDKLSTGSCSEGTFRDPLKYAGGYGPEMVCIPAGTFRMGDIQGGGYENEQPVHYVSVGQFAMGKYEVTFAEYDKFAEATGRTKPYDNGWGRGNRPVIQVSWYDATAYTEWLSNQTGKQYRLPTEAEWEYAARAGTSTNYWWGNYIDNSKANYDSILNKTSPVGSYAANQFDLYDTSGNLWEWTCSEYEVKYNGQEKQCVTNASSLSLRGGSWLNSAGDVRSACREGLTPTNRFEGLGFRVSRQ